MAYATVDANGNAVNVDSMTDSDGSLIFVRSSEHKKATFRYAGNFTPVATPTDVLMIQGSATRTLRIKHTMLGGVATANGNMQATLIRRSTQFTTQGSAVFNAITAGKQDTLDAAATGVVATIGTANLTSVGATAGNLGQGRLFLTATATGTPAYLTWTFATRQDKALILRGVSDFVFLNLNGGAVPTGGSIDFEIEIEEDVS